MSWISNVMGQVEQIVETQAGFDMIDAGNHYFMVKLDLEEDRTKIIEGGPWMIFLSLLYSATLVPTNCIFGSYH